MLREIKLLQKTKVTWLNLLTKSKIVKVTEAEKVEWLLSIPKGELDEELLMVVLSPVRWGEATLVIL